MIQFYSPDIASTGELTPDESLHCAKVLRHRVGDRIAVTDGRGNLYDCQIVEADRKCVKVDIISTTPQPKSWSGRLIVAVAPTKNFDRIDWLVEKLVECGVDEIVPIDCRNSERHVAKSDRLQRIAVSAMKQSLKSRLPIIHPLVGFDAMVREFSDVPSKLIGYCDASLPRAEFVERFRPGVDTLIVIGPEGDFDPAEIELALGQGFEAVTFGNERLRTETAALYGVIAAHTLINQHQLQTRKQSSQQ